MLSDFQKRSLQIAELVAQQMQAKLKDPRGTIIAEEIYWYTHDYVSCPVGPAPVNVNIPIQSDADFDCYFLSSGAFDAAGVNLQAPPLTIQITDSGTGRTLFSNPTVIWLAAGQMGAPFILQNVRQFKSKTNIQISYTNLSAAIINVQTVFAGTKVFYKDN